MTYEEMLRQGRLRLEQAGVFDSGTDSRLLLEYVTGKNHAWLLAHGRQEAAQAEAASFEALLKRRCRRIPLQHLTGVQNFMGLDFRVSPQVLIPRQDTEVLAELALRQAQPGWRVLDMCTGSGCIAVALKHFQPLLQVTAADISPDALAVARENGGRHKTDILWVQSDLFANIRGTYEMILSNPPYIPRGEIETLQPEVARYDPRLALDGGEDGLDVYRRLIRQAPSCLVRGGRLLLEIGWEQGPAVSGLLQAAGFSQIAVHKDLAGLDRVAEAVKQ